MLDLKFKLISQTATSPQKNYQDDAGIDIFCDKDYELKPNEQCLLQSGVSMKIPQGYAGIIKDRSSMAVKRNLQTLAGVIDCQYTGEILIAMKNISQTNTQHIKTGEKIAQMLILPVPIINLQQIKSDEELEQTERGSKGFGSSGK